MVNVGEFTEKIKSIVSQEYEIAFLGGRERFDDIVSKLSDSQSQDIYEWVQKIVDKSIVPLSKASKKAYKAWEIKDLLSFRKELTVDNQVYRILFVKVKNACYIEFHLGDHKYYDRLRKQLDLTKKNY